MAPQARRISLSPVQDPGEAALTEAAMRLPDALAGRVVTPGDAIDLDGTAYHVTVVDPPGPATAHARETEITLAPARPREARRLVHDVLFLVDASWTMGRNRDTRFAPVRYVAPAVEPFVRQCVDFVRVAGVATFAREAVMQQDFAPLGTLEVSQVDALKPRGPTNLEDGLVFALGALGASADPRDRHAVVLFTDHDAAMDEVSGGVKRATRLGVRVHVVDLGDAPSRGLQDLAQNTRGTYVHAPHSGTLGPAARAMADEVEVPFTWREPPPEEADGVEFEIVLRTLPDAEA